MKKRKWVALAALMLAFMMLCTTALARGGGNGGGGGGQHLSLIHISEPTRLLSISYAVFCLKKKNRKYH